MNVAAVVLGGIAAIEAGIMGLRSGAWRRRALLHDRSALRRQLAAHQDVSRVVAGTSAADAAAPGLAQAVARDLGWDAGVVWEAETGRTPCLRAIDAWSRTPQLETVAQAALDRRLPADEALAGRVWGSGDPVWTTDLAGIGDDAATRAGARTGAAVPLLGPAGVLGVLCAYAVHPRRHEAQDLEELQTVGRSVGALLARRRITRDRAELERAQLRDRRRAERAERRASFLADAGPRLASALDVDATALALAQLAVPELADFCAVDVLDGDGRLRRIAVAHASRYLERRAWELAEDAAVDGTGIRRALDTSAPVLIPGTDDALVEAGLVSRGQVERMRALEVEAALVVPLRASGGGNRGAVLLGMGPSGRAFGGDDLEMAEALADRAAQAMDNARLFSAERAASAQAQRTARELAAAQERFRAAFEHAPIGVGVVSVGEAPRWVQVNPALCDILGRPEEHVLGTGVLEHAHPDDAEADGVALGGLAGGDVPELRRETRYVQPDGTAVWVLVRARLIRDGDDAPRHAVVQVQDITDRKRYEGQLEYLAEHDALTGLYNRRRFEHELDRAVANARRFGEGAAVLVVDLDNFKYVNDTYGHAVGDELLGRVAGALRTRLRETDVLGRLGGDEFAVILPRVSVAEARTAAEQLVAAVRHDGAITVGERRLRATCSVGINIVDPASTLTAEELLVEADLAMYEAKAAGRDRVASVAPGEASRAKMKARMTWSERIRDALEHDHFELWEQPIRALLSGVQDRAELLIRMLDVNGDAIPPGVFLYIAERFGQIQAVDRWVIARAIRLLAERDQIFEVNLSGASITDEATIDFIASEIANAPIDPTKLVFEVTETTAIVNVERARRFARRLSDLGCQFALDDFGAGFGSFYYLKHLPFDCVKIDGDFVKDLPLSPADQLTVKAIVQIARGLGKETVAEFVQDERTEALLRDYGVDYGQGYHVGRPRRATHGRRPMPSRLRA